MRPHPRNLIFSLISASVFLVFVQADQPAQAQFDDVTRWQGTLDVTVSQLQLNIEIRRSDEDLAGTIYSVDQNNAKIPISKVAVDGDSLVIEASSVNATFTGTLNEDRSRATGKWSQGGSEFDLELRRVESFRNAEAVEAWRGMLDAGVVKLEMGIRVFRDPDGKLTAKLDSYSEGALGLPVDFSREGDRYIIVSDALGIRYEAELNEEQDQLSGTFSQNGQELELEMKKTELNARPKVNRPQTPKKPYPYREETVSFENVEDGVELAGSLTLPRGEGPFAAAILISGSGPQDRDETIYQHKPFLVLADHLTRAGVAVLRFDDRGTAKSGGDFGTATSLDFSRDVEAGVEFLKAHPRIAAGKVGMIGHSEGGLIAPLVAAKRPDIAFIVLLAGPGVDGGQVLVSQTRVMSEKAGADPRFLDAQEQLVRRICERVKSERRATAAELKQIGAEIASAQEDETIRNQLTAVTEALAGRFATPWFRFFIMHDPAGPLRQVTCPVLALNGEKDLQVLADLNMNAIEAALRESGNRDFELQRLPDLNHLFQETSGPGLAVEYGQIEQTFSPVALKLVSDWIVERTR